MKTLRKETVNISDLINDGYTEIPNGSEIVECGLSKSIAHRVFTPPFSEELYDYITTITVGSMVRECAKKAKKEFGDVLIYNCADVFVMEDGEPIYSDNGNELVGYSDTSMVNWIDITIQVDPIK